MSESYNSNHYPPAGVQRLGAGTETPRISHEPYIQLIEIQGGTEFSNTSKRYKIQPWKTASVAYVARVQPADSLSYTQGMQCPEVLHFFQLSLLGASPVILTLFSMMN